LIFSAHAKRGRGGTNVRREEQNKGDRNAWRLRAPAGNGGHARLDGGARIVLRETGAVPVQGLVAGSSDRGLVSRTFDTREGLTDEFRIRANTTTREESSLVKDDYFRPLAVRAPLPVVQAQA
jgi:hypothetical protein